METGRKYTPIQLDEIVEIIYVDGKLEIYHHGRNSWTQESLLKHLGPGHSKTRVAYCIPLEVAKEANELSDAVDSLMNRTERINLKVSKN